jgi:nucleoside phosphorylase
MRRRAAGLAAHASESRLPWVEDMETAAIALACVRAGKTLLALRGISNQAGDRNKSRWDIPAAARAAQAAAWLAVTGRELESLGGNSRS